MASAWASRALLLSRGLHAGAASRSVVPTLLRRPLAAAASLLPPAARAAAGAEEVRCFATQPAAATSSSLPVPEDICVPRIESSRPSVLLAGCDFEHWLVVMEPPPGDPSNPDTPRDEIIDSYIKTLAKVVGSEEEARKKIYMVSTRHYFAFGALVSEELTGKLKELPKVRWVLVDSYLDPLNKDYGGEPFINGEVVPYDPKYHKEWEGIRSNHRGGGKNEYPGDSDDQWSDWDDQWSDFDDQWSDWDDQWSDLGDQGQGSDSDTSYNTYARARMQMQSEPVLDIVRKNLKTLVEDIEGVRPRVGDSSTLLFLDRLAHHLRRAAGRLGCRSTADVHAPSESVAGMGSGSPHTMDEDEDKDKDDEGVQSLDGIDPSQLQDAPPTQPSHSRACRR